MRSVIVSQRISWPAAAICARVQELLGHASLSTTQRYTAVDMTRLVEVYDKAPPPAPRRP